MFSPSGVTVTAVAAVDPTKVVTTADPIVMIDLANLMVIVDSSITLDLKGTTIEPICTAPILIEERGGYRKSLGLFCQNPCCCLIDRGRRLLDCDLPCRQTEGGRGRSSQTLVLPLCPIGQGTGAEGGLHQPGSPPSSLVCRR
ncbi:unnamed protein product [Cuscuta campestris]|uniref:Uncharacterized protein n=1 Tax=Cuscuta campestris TaxID=132261 RepID=A0A484NIS9_9ASTE|nr:unnamed protein product [Cuscuta campestris]